MKRDLHVAMSSVNNVVIKDGEWTSYSVTDGALYVHCDLDEVGNDCARAVFAKGEWLYAKSVDTGEA